MGMDKKVLKGKLRLVLLRKLGRADLVSDYSPQALDETLRAYFE
jgi:3-dehydroquinate synthase